MMKLENWLNGCVLGGLVMMVSLTLSDAQIRFSGGEKKELKLDWFLEEEDLFDKSADDLEKEIGSSNFVWQEKERTHARFNPEKRDLRLNGVKVGETLVSLKDGKINSVTVSYLNKGDDGRIDRTTYTKTIEKAKDAVAVSGGSDMREEKRPKNEQVTKAEAALWRGDNALYLLEHLFLEEEEFREDGWIWTIPAHAEFVRLRILPPQDQLGSGVEKFRTSVSRSQLSNMVVRRGKKAIIPGIPMVNQGSKGYCAVASLERVIRYYGADIDMHDLANLANTYGGTDPNEMKETVHRVGRKLSMTSKFPIFTKPKDMKRMAVVYNRAAKKKGLTQAPESYRFFYQADNELLKNMRADGSDYDKFKREIYSNINRGIPVLWALHLGLYWEDHIEGSYEANRYAITQPEADEKDEGMADVVKKMDEKRKAEMEKMREEMPRPPEYMQGGHMRLIIGYNQEEDVVYYTDSWGPGHEKKKMSMKEAYTATYALMVLEPR
ncbi:MAG: C39 family peptidase [Verrucomicrobiales bacterium]